MSEVRLYLADGVVWIRRADEPSRLATAIEIAAWRTTQLACWGCQATR